MHITACDFHGEDEPFVPATWMARSLVKSEESQSVLHADMTLDLCNNHIGKAAELAKACQLMERFVRVEISPIEPRQQ